MSDDLQVSGLKAAAKANSTLNTILDDDLKKATVRIQGSLSRQLRRVRQGIDLIATLFQNFLSSKYVSFLNFYYISHKLIN